MIKDKDQRTSIRRKRLQSRDKKSILIYLRQLAKSLGKDTLTRYDIKEDGEISNATIHRKFGGFSHALIEAGLKPKRIYKRDPKRMVYELANLMQNLGNEPSKSEIASGTSFNSRHYELEFGSLKHAFDLAQDHAESLSKDESINTHVLPVKLSKTKRRRRKYGEAIRFRGLRHAPINELGVVFLFGMLSEKLGFEVESIQSGFPDCDAKLKMPDGTFERVRIEFEFKSREFVKHGHDPNGCDLLVCWEHDWPDVPDEIEIIELKTIIGNING